MAVFHDIASYSTHGAHEHGTFLHAYHTCTMAAMKGTGVAFLSLRQLDHSRGTPVACRASQCSQSHGVNVESAGCKTKVGNAYRHCHTEPFYSIALVLRVRYYIMVHRAYTRRLHGYMPASCTPLVFALFQPPSTTTPCCPVLIVNESRN